MGTLAYGQAIFSVPDGEKRRMLVKAVLSNGLSF